MGIIIFSKDSVSQVLESRASDYSSKYIIVFNRESKTINYEGNFDKRAFPASLTKIIATIVALDHIDDLSELAPVDIAV